MPETCLAGTNYPVSRQFIRDGVEAGISAATNKELVVDEMLTDEEVGKLRAIVPEITQVLFGEWRHGDCGCPAVKAELTDGFSPPEAVRIFAFAFDRHCFTGIPLKSEDPHPHRLVVEDA